MIGWTIFAIEDKIELLTYLKSLFINDNIIDNFSLFEVGNNFILLIICIIASTPIINNIYKKISKNLIIKTLILTALLIINLAYLISSNYNPFLYFRF